MKKLLLAAVSGLALLGAPAMAADLPEAVIEQAVAVPSFSWTGAYVGVFAGYAFAQGDVRVLDRDGYQTGFSRRFGYDFDDGFTGGLTLGYNYQFDGSPVVLGIEGELGYLGLDGSGRDPLGPGGDSRSKAEFEDFYATLTGRIGFAFDQFLVFGKAGVAYVDPKVSYRDNCAVALGCGPLTVNARGNGEEFHLTVGAGLEYAVTENVSVKAEYTYIASGQVVSARGVDSLGFTRRFGTEVPDLHIVKAGLNYRFNW